MIKIIGLLLLVSLPVEAAITRVQFKSAAARTASLVVTLDSAPLDGSLLVIGIGTEAGSIGRVSTITQTGATWTRVIEVAGTGSPSNTSEIWYAKNVQSASTTITVSLIAAPTLRCTAVVAEYSGADPLSPLDQNVGLGGDWSVAQPDTSLTTEPTTTAPNEVWFTYASTIGGSSVWNTAGSGYTEIAEAKTGSTGVDVNSAADDKIVTAVGTLHSDMTTTPVPVTGGWSIVAASFQQTIVKTTDPLPMMGIGG